MARGGHPAPPSSTIEGIHKYKNRLRENKKILS
jgi:hypothetical protein